MKKQPEPDRQANSVSARTREEQKKKKITHSIYTLVGGGRGNWRREGEEQERSAD